MPLRPKNYQKYLLAEQNRVNGKVTLLPKAEDQFLAVACSSIIARYLFLESLKALSLEAGYTLPSGAGAASDQVAAKLIRQNGRESLKNMQNYILLILRKQ